MKIFLTIFTIFLFLYSANAQAGDEDIAKQNIISEISNSLAASLENIIGGEGDTEVKISGGVDLHPSFSIMTVRPLAIHPEVDAWFVQLQLNETKVRASGRYSINTGVGYRKLSSNKNSFTGGNVFIDWDEKGNARTSVGFELRSSAFEAIGNYYRAISGGKTVGAYTERALDGIELSLVGEVPYLPWANIIANHYEWRADQNSKDSKGDKFSLEMVLTPNFIVEAGSDDNNLDGANNFVKAYLIFPARERVAASNNFIGETAFSDTDMSGELLSKVRRTNTIIVESEGTGVVIGRTSE